MSIDSVQPGWMPLQAPSGEFNRVSFIIQQAIAKMQTATVVRVESCTNNGGLSPVGFVDVVPMVNQIDSQGNPMPHTTIHNIPYSRIQGGSNGIVIDPEPGDIGICLFASRDISKVKSTKKQANPGSLRQNSFSDGMYIGGILNGTPTQYIQFNASGIKIHSPSSVVLDAPVVTINAATSCTVNTATFTVNGATVLHGSVSQTGGGASSFSGSITATGDISGQGVSMKNHVHSGVTTGGSNTGAPV